MAGDGPGRPQADIDWKKVDQLLEAGCLATEIAAYFGIHRNTLYSRCQEDKKVDFSAYTQEKRAKGDSLLRAKQFETAFKGNVTMQIWLGKQRLGQRDNNEESKMLENLVSLISDLKNGQIKQDD